MLKLAERRPSPAMVVAIIGLVVALAGTALAASALTKKQKTQVNKIATKVFNKNIGGASVKHASSADSATKANTATSASTATNATKAADADKLGGQAASTYQHVLQGSCPGGGIEAIGSGGEVSCITPVRTISHDLGTPDAAFDSLPGGLQLANVCHDGATEFAFQNLGSGGATLNWIYSNGTTVSATGVNVNASSEFDFDFAGKRIEGQFIWASAGTVVTLNLHAFDGGTFCEFKGTAESQSG
jgi:hypothetical protein